MGGEALIRYATLRQLGRVEFGQMRDDERNLVLSSWTESLVDSMGHGVRSGSKHRHAYLVSTGKLVVRCDGLLEVWERGEDLERSLPKADALPQRIEP
jgi:hypothetical protein